MTGLWTLTPEKFFAEEDFVQQYPLEHYPSPALRAFLWIDLDDRSPEALDYDTRPYFERIQQAIQAFLQHWGSLEQEVMLSVLTKGEKTDRLLALFAIGLGDNLARARPPQVAKDAHSLSRY